MATRRIVTIHHDRMTLSDIAGTFPITSFASTYSYMLTLANERGDEPHVEIELAPNALIVCRHCGIQYDATLWVAVTYYEHEYAPGAIVEIRRCMCGVDLTPEHALLRPSLISN